MNLEALVPKGTMIQERYEVVSVVGAGGTVAIKMMELTGVKKKNKLEVYLKRFEREAVLISRLRHPNVLKIYGYGAHGEQQIPYMVVELLRGHDMHAHLHKHGAVHATRVFPLFLPILDAIGVAHEHGVVHKDLCPSNLFWRHPGQPEESWCVLDFGIAYWRSAAARLTAKNTFMGTPRYIAPEYALTQTVGPTVDVYQLGLVLVELLCGAPVIRAKDKLKALLAHTRGELEVPERMKDTALWPVIQSALALDPDARYANAHAFAEALAGVAPVALPHFTPDEPTCGIT
jgi:serine/threonine protein kinase